MATQSSSSNPIDISVLSLDNKKFEKRDLFGGAITLSIPSAWRDVSDVRQVPDHQEVYQDCTFVSTSTSSSNNSLQGTGGCVVVEILERQDDVHDDDASSFFFHDLADANKGDGEDNDDRISMDYNHVWTVGKSEHNIRSEKLLSESKCNSDEEDDTTNALVMPNLTARVIACSCIGYQSVGPLTNRDKLEEGKAENVKIEMCVLRLEAVQTDLLISLSMPVFSAKKVDTSKSKDDLAHSTLFLSMLKSFEVVDWSLFA